MSRNFHRFRREIRESQARADAAAFVVRSRQTSSAVSVAMNMRYRKGLIRCESILWRGA